MLVPKPVSHLRLGKLVPNSCRCCEMFRRIRHNIGRQDRNFKVSCKCSSLRGVAALVYINPVTKQIWRRGRQYAAVQPASAAMNDVKSLRVIPKQNNWLRRYCQVQRAGSAGRPQPPQLCALLADWQRHSAAAASGASPPSSMNAARPPRLRSVERLRGSQLAAAASSLRAAGGWLARACNTHLPSGCNGQAADEPLTGSEALASFVTGLAPHVAGAHRLPPVGTRTQLPPAWQPPMQHGHAHRVRGTSETRILPLGASD